MQHTIDLRTITRYHHLAITKPTINQFGSEYKNQTSFQIMKKFNTIWQGCELTEFQG